ncbi:SGNH/GDSL hydrolase family protein [candidate division KSB1 bacterium]
MRRLFLIMLLLPVLIVCSGSKDNGRVIVCFGDSITNGGGSWESPSWVLHLERLIAEDKEPGEVTVINSGIGGHTTVNALERIERDVIRYKPAVVLVEFGINDSGNWKQENKLRFNVSHPQYHFNLVKIVSLIQANTEAVVIMVANHNINRPEPMPMGLSHGEANRDYNETVREIADHQGLLLLDMEKEFPSGEDGYLREDGVHLSLKGNRTYAEIVYRALTGWGLF